MGAKLLLTSEPTATINAIVRVIELGIVMFVAFGLDWTTEQIAAVVAFVTAVGFAVQTVFVRARVTPVADPHDNDGDTLVPVFSPPSGAFGE